MRRAAMPAMRSAAAAVSDAGRSLQGAGIGVEHGGERTEPLEQHPCEGLDVTPGDRRHQQVFDQFVIGERIIAPSSKRSRSRARWPLGSCAASRTRSSEV
jgi:hypothetical protein